MSKEKTRDVKATVVADSQLSTVLKAAKKNGVSAKTVKRYRAESLIDPDLAAEAREKRLAAQAAMTEKTAELQAEALRLAYETIIAVMSAPDASNQDKLTAYKLLTDRLSADKLAEVMMGDDVTK